MTIYKIRRKSDGAFLLKSHYPHFTVKKNCGVKYASLGPALQQAQYMQRMVQVHGVQLELVEYKLVENSVLSIEQK